LRHALLQLLLLGLSKVLRWLSLAPARRLGAWLGARLYPLLWTERRLTLEHLQAAFPEQERLWRRTTAKAVFTHWGQSAVDFFRLADLDRAGLESWVAEVRGLEYLLEGKRLGMGTVVVTPHLGHWELLGNYAALHTPVAAVARQIFDARIDQALNAQREGLGVKVFPRNTSVLPILRWLKEGGVLGVLADQDTSVDSLFCEFFGRPAKTPTGGVLLAQAAKARLITGYCWRQGDGRYVVEFEAAIPVPPRQDRDVMALWPAAQEYTRRIEAKIRQHPEQWVWMHRRWKSRMDQDSNGWQSRQAQACQDRIAQWVAAGRPELKA
jgi:KDO2-lipid IV(A) lauroyltransferase